MSSNNQLVRSAGLDWAALAEDGIDGIEVKPLRVDPADGRTSTMLLRFAPGAQYPLHDHPAGEEVFVLEGDIRLGKDVLNAGDYLFTAPGNLHRASSDGGCVVLLRAPKAVIIRNGGQK